MLRLIQTVQHGLEVYLVLWSEGDAMLTRSFLAEESARTFISKRFGLKVKLEVS